MNINSAKIRLREAYRDNDWVVILTLVLRFGAELLTLLNELRAERKKKLDKKKD